MEFIWPVFTYLFLGMVAAFLAFNHLKREEDADGLTISDFVVFILLWPFVLVVMLIARVLR